MLNPRDLKFFAIGAVIVASGLSVFAAVNIPNTFTPNTPIKAEEVNANFSSLKASIEALQASSGTVADGTLTSSKFADGAIISSKLADASVSAAKLITTAPASSGKFLSFDGSSLSWADGTAGTVGSQGPKGDTGAVGPAGAKGDTGAAGPQGVKGDTGATGAVGPAGQTGPQGAPGISTRKFISGFINATPNLGAGFTFTRNSTTQYTVNWPAGTFNGAAIPLVQTFSAAGRISGWSAGSDGSGVFTFVGIDSQTIWFTITALQ